MHADSTPAVRRNRGRTNPNGAGSVYYSPARRAWLATYSRGLDAARKPIVKRFQAATESEARSRRDEDRRLWETLPPLPAQIDARGRAYVRLSSLPFRAWIHQRDGGRCGICGQPVALEDMHVDHIRPRIEGGNDAVTNLRATHPVCNLRRRDERARRILV